jgi:hypothetical protein
MSKVGILSSAGITRFHRYYDPLRSPKQPSLALTSCWLVSISGSTAGVSRVPCAFLCMHVVVITPASPMEAVRSYSSIISGLPRQVGGSAPALTVSRPIQRSFALQPTCSQSRQNDSLHRRLQQLRYLRYCFDRYRVERTSSRVGLSPTEKHRLITAHDL